MINSVKGKIFKKEPTMLYVDTGSIVLTIHICLRDYEKIPNVGENISINTFLNVKENGQHVFLASSKQITKQSF